MLNRIREPFGKAGLIVAIVALVFAMLGGAYAATGLNSKQKKEVKSIAKSFQGTGPAGPQGPSGSKGTDGAQGSKGDPGAAGTNGIDGTDGENGMCSEANPECALASGGTLTGAWSVANPSESAYTDLSAISFPVQVSPAPTALVTKEFSGFILGLELRNGSAGFYGPGQEFETLEEIEEDEQAFLAACPGSVSEPEAAPGFLCIYEGATKGSAVSDVAPVDAEAANEFGVVVPWSLGPKTSLRGTWAATAN